ncbi:hypothetical protein [Roseivirga sp.]|uniref:hypothetical protein n=1 Tax=Roseivirga sp. TaxID=1964215 RepID=UPI003B52EA36
MGNFESELRDMFDGAEFQPSEQVWAGVESALAQKKKKGIFMMWQTYGIAAAVVFFITAGMLYKNGYFQSTPGPVDNKPKLTQTEGSTTDSTSIQKPSSNSVSGQQLAGTTEGQEDETINLNANEPDAVDPTQLARIDNQVLVTDQLLTAQVNQTEVTESTLAVPVETNSLRLQLAVPKAYRQSIAATQARWLNSLGVDLSSLTADAEPAVMTPDFKGEQMLNGRLGNNSFNIATMPGNTESLSTQAVDSRFNAYSSINNEEEQALGSVSAGIGFATELSRRLQLNMSLRYTELRVRSSSNAYSEVNGVSYPIYLPLGYDPTNVNFIGRYNLTNTIQGLSVQPTLSYKMAQFGRFDVSVIGGVGVDYFFSYRVKGDLNFLSVRKANLNDSDFIKNFNLSGITGLGVNYRINPSLGLSADINYRYFVPTSSSDTQRRASVLGFGLSVNYFLKRD